MSRRPASHRRMLLCALVLSPAVLSSVVVVAAPAAASTPSCSLVSIATLDRALGIDAAKVNTVHPASPVGSLICSFYGLSGGEKNEATINFVPATPKAFTDVEAAEAKQHATGPIGGLLGPAYYYRAKPNYFLFVLDGGWQLQIFAAVRLGELVALAKKLPLLSS